MRDLHPVHSLCHSDPPEAEKNLHPVSISTPIVNPTTMHQHNYYVYIMSAFSKIIYIGVTNNLIRRVEEHKQKIADGFTKKYNLGCLVYYEYFTDINYAIAREKELKGWRREKKINLIKNTNPTWRDLYNDLIGG